MLKKVKISVLVNIIFISSVSAMDYLPKKKSKSKNNKTPSLNNKVPALDFQDAKPGRNTGSLGGASSSGGTPKTPVKSLEELKRNVTQVKANYGLSGEDSSQKNK